MCPKQTMWHQSPLSNSGQKTFPPTIRRESKNHDLHYCFDLQYISKTSKTGTSISIATSSFLLLFQVFNFLNISSVQSPLNLKQTGVSSSPPSQKYLRLSDVNLHYFLVSLHFILFSPPFLLWLFKKKSQVGLARQSYSILPLLFW